MCKLEEILLKHSISAAQVGRIGVKTNRLLPVNLTYHRPVTGLQAKFSMEFCLASMLVLGRAGLAEFTDEVVNRPDIQDAIRRIDYTCYDDAEAQANQYPLLATFLEVELRDGRKFAGRVDVARGSPPISMTDEDVAEKFRQCAAYADWPEQRSARIIEAALNLEKLPRFSDLTALLSAPADGR
jgi:2-methylcitrate dehydratase PrpD